MKKILITLTVLVLLVSPLMATTTKTDTVQFTLNYASAQQFEIKTGTITTATDTVTNWSSYNTFTLTDTAVALKLEDSALKANSSDNVAIAWAATTAVSLTVSAQLSNLTVGTETGAAITLGSATPSINPTVTPTPAAIPLTSGTSVNLSTITTSNNVIKEQFGCIYYSLNNLAFAESNSISNLPAISNETTLTATLTVTIKSN